MTIPYFLKDPMSVQLNQTALWQNLRVVNQLQKEEIEILEKLIEVLLSSEDEIIDEWLDRLERHTKHRFTDEEARMIRSEYPFLSEHRRDYTLAMDRIRKARADWEEDGNVLTLWNFLERDYFDRFMQHLVDFDFSSENHEKRNRKPRNKVQPQLELIDV